MAYGGRSPLLTQIRTPKQRGLEHDASRRVSNYRNDGFRVWNYWRGSPGVVLFSFYRHRARGGVAVLSEDRHAPANTTEAL